MRPEGSSSSYIEALTVSLVQEYLHKKEFYVTLKTFFSEQFLPPSFSHRRAPLVKELEAENLIAANKQKGSPISSVLELVIKSYLSNLKKPRAGKGRRIGVQVNLEKPQPAKARTRTSTKFVQTKQAFLKNEVQQTDKNSHCFEAEAQVGSSLEIEEDDDDNSNTHNSSQQTSYSQDSFILTKSPEPEGEKSDSQSDSEVLEKVASPPTSKSGENEKEGQSPNGSAPQKISEAKRSTPQRVFGRSLSSSRSPTMDEPTSDPEDYHHVASTMGQADNQAQRSISHEHHPTDPQATNDSSTSSQSFHSEFQIKKLPSNNVTNTVIHDISPAESILQSKREILAKGSLSYMDFQKRSKQQQMKSSKNSKSLSFTDSTFSPISPQKSPSKTLPQKVEALELCDIEDEDLSQLGSSSKDHLSMLRRNGQCDLFDKRYRLDFSSSASLQRLVIGKSKHAPEGWLNQGFLFNKELPYGLLQRRGGPCGVLAVVQAFLLKNLVFTFEQNSENSLPSSPILMSKRNEALSSSLFQILSRCSSESVKDKSKFLVKLCINSASAEILEFSSAKNLSEFLSMDSTLSQLDCLGLVYSALLTRGFELCQEDMDFPDSPLIGQHGYCSSELINLLLLGKCFSNQFDKEVCLDGKVLRGIPHQSEIGFLSLFEHFGSCEVGSFLKNPQFPIWIVCSESHFSVLFSLSMKPLSCADFCKEFDLYYYDGLANQQQDIKLTISFGSSISQPEPDADLVSPLEKCIRTKWKNACISWNGTEPLL